MISAIRQHQPDLHDDALLSHIPRLVQNIRAKPHDVPGEKLRQFTLAPRLAEPDVVDEGSVAAARVEKKEATLVTLVQEQSVSFRQHLV